MKNKSILVSLVIILLSTVVIAQDDNSAKMAITLNIPAIALIDFAVVGNQTITFTYSESEPNKVEQIITPSTADKTWLNYSSIVRNGSTNYITVHISSGSLPADVSLKVMIGDDVGAGAGSTGNSQGQIILSSYPQSIITNIGSCYTGRGGNKGHQLTYVWVNSSSYDYSLKYENGEAIGVTYTITSTE